MALPALPAAGAGDERPWLDLITDFMESPSRLTYRNLALSKSAMDQFAVTNSLVEYKMGSNKHKLTSVIRRTMLGVELSTTYERYARIIRSFVLKTPAHWLVMIFRLRGLVREVEVGSDYEIYFA